MNARKNRRARGRNARGEGAPARKAHENRGVPNNALYIYIYPRSKYDFAFRIVNFPHMDSNIPANPVYGVYISQLVRYARISVARPKLTS